MAKRKIRQDLSKNYIGIEEAVEYYIADKEMRGCSSATIKNTKAVFSRVFKEDIGIQEDDDVSRLDKRVMYDWIKKMQERKLSCYTINTRLAEVREFMRWGESNAIDGRILFPDGYRLANSIKNVKKEETMPRTYTDEELNKLLVKPSEDIFQHNRTWMMIIFCFATGSRIGSIRELQIKHLDFDNDIITYPHTKTRRAETVPMDTELKKILKTSIYEWLSADEITPNTYLFPSSFNDKPISYSGLWKSMVRYCEKRGISNTGYNRLRNSFARGIIKNNGNPFVLQRLLTHNSITMTNKYVHLWSEDIKEGYEKINPFNTFMHKNDKEHIVYNKRKKKK